MALNFSISFLILKIALHLCRRMFLFIGNTHLKYSEKMRLQVGNLFSNGLEKGRKGDWTVLTPIL